MSSFGNIRQSAHGRLKETPGRVEFVVHIAEQLILTANLVADINRQRFQGTHLRWREEEHYTSAEISNARTAASS